MLSWVLSWLVGLLFFFSWFVVSSWLVGLVGLLVSQVGSFLQLIVSLVGLLFQVGWLGWFGLSLKIWNFSVGF